MGLRYATVTGVARDDLDDEGAWLYAQTVREIHAATPGTGVELLIPDFSGDAALLAQVFDAAPEVLAHNVETVPAHLQADPARVPVRPLAARSSPPPPRPAWSPSRTSSWASARPRTRWSRRCTTCTPPAATW